MFKNRFEEYNSIRQSYYDRQLTVDNTPGTEFFLARRGTIQGWNFYSMELGYHQPGFKFNFKGYVGATMPNYSPGVQSLMTTQELHNSVNLHPTERFIASILGTTVENGCLRSWKEYQYFLSLINQPLIISRPTNYGGIYGEEIKSINIEEFISIVDSSGPDDFITEYLKYNPNSGLISNYYWQDSQGYPFSRFPARDSCIQIMNFHNHTRYESEYQEAKERWESLRIQKQRKKTTRTKHTDGD